MEFGVVYRGAQLGTFHLPMLGRHLVQNCLAAIAVGIECGVTIEVIRSALASFGGVKRRLEVVGQSKGITVMNDYGHHPTEIRATLRAVRECLAPTMNQLIVLFQPHRYTRTEGCWNEYLTSFKDADTLLLAEIYAASETPIPGITGENLCRAVEHSDKLYLPQIEEAPEVLLPMLKRGDVVVCQGAGSVGLMPEKLLAAIEASDLLEAESATAVAAVGQ
jgi:UDP-N-acetylmuramate--alanine ligase